VAHVKKLHAPVDNALTRVQKIQSNLVRDDWKIKADKLNSLFEFIHNILSRSHFFFFGFSTDVE
jgi:hypothetical protein